MPATPVLTVTNDDTFLGMLKSKLREQLNERGRIAAAPSIDEAYSLMKTARPRLIVVHLGGDGGQYEQFDRLLWATSVLSRPTPIVVIAERYLIEQATTLYRMGVSEYISRTHHLDQVADILEAYLRPATPRVTIASNDNGAAARWGPKHVAASMTAQVV
jgi:DNA-binding NarL/FixJ family response regulator